MIRFKLDKDSTDIIERLNSLYDFKDFNLTMRIAFGVSLQSKKRFDGDDAGAPSSDGKEFTPTSNAFGDFIDNRDNLPIYRSVMDKYYDRSLSEEEFKLFFKRHVNHGVKSWLKDIESGQVANGHHMDVLKEYISKSLSLRSGRGTGHRPSVGGSRNGSRLSEFTALLPIYVGKDKDGNDVIIELNNTFHLVNRNIAVAGISGSGKTQLVKDMLYQISNKSNHEVKFIFFDYKGTKKDSIATFLEKTNCAFVDPIQDGGIDFNPFFMVSKDDRARDHNIHKFASVFEHFTPQMGQVQLLTLKEVIRDLFNHNREGYPTLNDLKDAIEQVYEQEGKQPDTLISVIDKLTLGDGLFNLRTSDQDKVLKQSLYLNLTKDLDDNIRQLIVFFLLNYFDKVFGSSEDCIPVGENENIFPVRYVIAIDEAHVYLSNKNARKALEDILRTLRSKGVMVIIMSQDVKDFDQKEFDFSSQIGLSLCLDVNDKSPRPITKFLGAQNENVVRSQLSNLETGKALLDFNGVKTIEVSQWWKTKQQL